MSIIGLILKFTLYLYLLFVLFINDIYESIDENSNINLYADDTKLWREITTYADSAILQKDINRLHKWCIVNNMKFHENKYKVLTVTNSKPLYGCLTIY